MPFYCKKSNKGRNTNLETKTLLKQVKRLTKRGYDNFFLRAQTPYDVSREGIARFFIFPSRSFVLCTSVYAHPCAATQYSF